MIRVMRGFLIVSHHRMGWLKIIRGLNRCLPPFNNSWHSRRGGGRAQKGKCIEKEVDFPKTDHHQYYNLTGGGENSLKSTPPPPLILPRTHSFSISSCCQSFSYSSLVLPCLNVPSSSIESIETLEQYFSRSLWVFHSKANLYQCRYTCRHFPVATRQSHQYLVFQFPKENCVESSELIPQCE